MRESSLITKAELSAIESLDSEKPNAPSQFSARLIVCPSFGQPGGPEEPQVAPVQTPDAQDGETDDSESDETPDSESAETPNTQSAETPDAQPGETPDTQPVRNEP